MSGVVVYLGLGADSVLSSPCHFPGLFSTLSSVTTHNIPCATHNPIGSWSVLRLTTEVHYVHSCLRQALGCDTRCLLYASKWSLFCSGYAMYVALGLLLWFVSCSREGGCTRKRYSRPQSFLSPSVRYFLVKKQPYPKFSKKCFWKQCYAKTLLCLDTCYGKCYAKIWSVNSVKKSSFPRERLLNTVQTNAGFILTGKGVKIKKPKCQRRGQININRMLILLMIFLLGVCLGMLFMMKNE